MTDRAGIGAITRNRVAGYIAPRLQKRSFDALPFKPISRPSFSRERFSQNVCVLGTKIVRHKTYENPGRAERRLS
jgi:hypothetical protein